MEVVREGPHPDVGFAGVKVRQMQGDECRTAATRGFDPAKALSELLSPGVGGTCCGRLCRRREKQVDPERQHASGNQQEDCHRGSLPARGEQLRQPLKGPHFGRHHLTRESQDP